MAERRPLPVVFMGDEKRRTVIVPTIEEAMWVGRCMAREDDQNEEDGSQDGALAFLELQKDGVNPVPLKWLRGRIMGHGSEDARAKRSRPLRRSSAHSPCQELPRWAL